MPQKTEAAFDAVTFLAQQDQRPGVYQMFDGAGNILYVGKAKSLKKRLSSYFAKTLSGKTRSLVDRIARIEVTVTATETEALLLEQNLIKQQLPPYNILLRDDKSFPYVFVSSDEPYPRLAFHRGPKRAKGKYFGPYPGSASVRESLQFLQKTFQVRQCEDSFFRNRSRPCLQYQIRRCTAPCVGYISEAAYAEDLAHTLMFLEGREETVMQELVARMEHASAALNFEQAARYRDQISHLRHIQEPQAIEEGVVDADVLAIAMEQYQACVQVITVRHGRILASRSFFPVIKLEVNQDEVLAAFLAQYYLGTSGREIPREIIVSTPLGNDQAVMQQALGDQAGRKVAILTSVRSHRARWCEMAAKTAKQNLLTRLASKQNLQQRFERLQEVLQLDEKPERIECFDISHSSGEATVASCVVFDSNGAVKSDYRRFNISGIEPGDDYAAMKQALTRRYIRLQQEESRLPDILLIDGGKGQVAMAVAVLHDLQIENMQIIGVAKGTTRKAGFETLVLPGRGDDQPVEKVLDSHDAALHLLQQIRDEAHRFAITGHKQRRDQKRSSSRLESVPGIGAARRRELLRFFGGQQEIARAGVEELMRVPGISRALAQAIYDAYH